jgi:hypothetical protein
LFSALCSTLVPGISIVETCIIYAIMVCASMTLSVVLTLIHPQADSRTH